MQKTIKSLAAAALLCAAAAPALADSQLIANAGLSPAEAAGLTLNEIAIAKFNRAADHDDRQIVATPGMGGDTAQLAANAGLDADAARGLSLTEIAVAKFNRAADHDDRQEVVSRSGVTMTSRSMNVAAFSQLAASAGLTVEEAKGMTLSEIAVAKFNRAADHDDRIGTAGYALGG